MSSLLLSQILFGGAFGITVSAVQYVLRNGIHHGPVNEYTRVGKFATYSKKVLYCVPCGNKHALWTFGGTESFDPKKDYGKSVDSCGEDQICKKQSNVYFVWRTDIMDAVQTEADQAILDKGKKMPPIDKDAHAIWELKNHYW